MDVEASASAWVLGGALLPIAWLLCRNNRKRRFPVFLLWLAGTLTYAWIARGNRPAPVPPGIPRQVSTDGYVSSDTCRSCHPREYETWHGSYHRSMTQRASPASITGRFSGQTERIYGRDYKLERRGDEFWVEFEQISAEAADGLAQPKIRRRIDLVTGSHHMQVYWYTTRHQGRLGMLPIVYLHEADRWVSRRSVFIEPPDGKHDEGGRWNVGCINCHTTQGETRSLNALEFDSQVAELGIACEACHGPGHEHIKMHRNPITRYASRLLDNPDHRITDPNMLDPHRSTEVCGKCHSASLPKSLEHQGAFRPGHDFAEFRNLLDPDKPESFGEDHASLTYSFWPDGMIRVAGREYSGLVRTPCYNHEDKTQTMSCQSCHSLHQEVEDPRAFETWADDQLKVGMNGNSACTQCHSEFADEGKLTRHTHHQGASSGSLCYNCHMPHTTYGLLKATRSHTIDSPDVATSLTTGRINACNQCHIDKPYSWTADHLHDWFAIDLPNLPEEHQRTSAVVHQALTGDAGQRALIAWTLGWPTAHETTGNDWIAPYLAQLLDDPYDAVRFIAYRSLRNLPGFAGFDYDYVAAKNQRTARSRMARAQWAALEGRKGHLPTLINQDGTLDTKRYESLLNRRNNRRMFLIE